MRDNTIRCPPRPKGRARHWLLRSTCFCPCAAPSSLTLTAGHSEYIPERGEGGEERGGEGREGRRGEDGGGEGTGEERVLQ